MVQIPNLETILGSILLAPGKRHIFLTISATAAVQMMSSDSITLYTRHETQMSESKTRHMHKEGQICDLTTAAKARRTMQRKPKKILKLSNLKSESDLPDEILANTPALLLLMSKTSSASCCYIRK